MHASHSESRLTILNVLQEWMLPAGQEEEGQLVRIMTEGVLVPRQREPLPLHRILGIADGDAKGRHK